MPTIIADYPKMHEWLAGVMMILNDLGALKLDKLIINDKIAQPNYKPEEDEEAPLVEDYYRLFAQILILKAKKDSPNQLK